MDIEQTFIQAAMKGRMLELLDADGRARIVEPYMIYTSSTGERLLHCYQLGGYSQSDLADPAGWRNPKVAAFTGARELHASFKPRKTYNPDNHKLFPSVSFALPRRGIHQTA